MPDPLHRCVPRQAQPTRLAPGLGAARGAENPYAAAIVKEMGIYPPGSFVKLANGETAVVARAGAAANAPHVASLTNAEGLVMMNPPWRDTARPEFKVVSTVPRANVLVRLNRQALFGYEA